MNTETKKCYFMGLARLGIREAKNLTQDKDVIEELNERERELENYSKEEVQFDFLYREFFYFMGEAGNLKQTIKEGSILKVGP
jgi:hypothetical protein